VDILYTKIAAQGYKLVYLTARPLSMANQTQNYLTQIGLPDGPILLWPNKMLKKGGLILGNPGEYKANCLLGIQVKMAFILFLI
jgi:phosphatidate phosphatase LPIN